MGSKRTGSGGGKRSGGGSGGKRSGGGSDGKRSGGSRKSNPTPKRGYRPPNPPKKKG